MTLRTDLADLIATSHADAWTTFDWVKHKAASLGMVKAKAAAKWKTPGEPAFVSNLIEYPFTQCRLRDLIYRHLGPLGLCSGRPVVSGVFIHQKPKVAFGPKRLQVELGDLLFVRQHFQSRVAAPQGRAFLVQAKSADAPRTGSLDGREAHQFSLYANWATPFRFPNKELGRPPDGAKRWNFSRSPMPALVNTGCYGIVANKRRGEIPATFPDACPWAVGAAGSVPVGAKPSVDASSMSLAAAFEGFLLGTWGRPWDSAPAPTDHWSSFVELCLRAAASWRGYPLKRFDAAALPRRRDVLAFVEAFAAAPLEFAPPVMAEHAIRDLTLALEGGHQRSADASRAIAHWRQSIGDHDRGRNDPPQRLDGDQAAPLGGLSVMYVATFGDQAIRGVGEFDHEDDRGD